MAGRSSRFLQALSGITVVAVTTAGFAACSSDDDGNRSIDVTLSEWIVEADPTSGDNGEIEFVGNNKGVEKHELVVVRAASAADLPTDADGAVDEAQLEDGALIGEVEDVAAKASKSVKLELESGSYVLFCNITEEESDGTIESHFKKGMHVSFEVT